MTELDLKKNGQPDVVHYVISFYESGLEHVRLRPGMYIGKLGDGAHSDDGIYVLIKEVIDNSIDEFRAGFGKKIEITREDRTLSVRDYGRGIPFGKLVDAVARMNTSGKFNENTYHKSVGLNGVGAKVANALSTRFVAQSVRDGKLRRIEYENGGTLVLDTDVIDNTDQLPNGTLIEFTPDDKIFPNFSFRDEIIENMLYNYSFLNPGLSFTYQGREFVSHDGLADLLRHRMQEEPFYPIIHLKGEGIEIAITHCVQTREDYYSAVNGCITSDGGSHLNAFKVAFGKTVKKFFNKNMDMKDIRAGVVAAISINLHEPAFEDSRKTELGSKYMDSSKNITINQFVHDFVKKELDDYLHKHPDVAESMEKCIRMCCAKRRKNDVDFFGE